ncbi:hypothetical protein NCAS_0A02220 [Naumovozyma castellii]|uniref:EF-hand domain-containing protein n=1 Tax=Naumovozyma castellii TaxID=27288 RepID=G0V5P2_NAUCA|nr:hypothetical protein NCAS_0A02220 [Naumovozyma castellii CBS 4309]CCC66780.1 hypothetical protein NCAS_0A02220 [Naumovozyma castellii CBS 4309]
MGKKKLNYATGDDLQLYATPKEAMEESRRRALEEKIRKRQQYEAQMANEQRRSGRISSAPVMTPPNFLNNNRPPPLQYQPPSQHNGSHHTIQETFISPNSRPGYNTRPSPPAQNMNVSNPMPIPHVGRTMNHPVPPYIRNSSSSPSSRQTSSNLQDPESKDIQVARKLFQNHDIKNRGRLTAEELQNLLQNDDNTHFCISSIDALINLFGATRFGTINQQEFVSLYKRVKIWRKVYVDNDINSSFTITVTEFHNSLQELQYLIPYEVSEKLFDQYAEFINENNNSKELKFDKFVEVLVWLMRLTRMFRKFDTQQDGVANIHYKDFIDMTLYLGRFLPH